MIRYIGQRLLQGAFVLWAAYTVSFFILYLLPGDAVSIMASGDEQNAVDPALVARLRSEYGLTGRCTSSTSSPSPRPSSSTLACPSRTASRPPSRSPKCCRKPSSSPSRGSPLP